MGMILNDFGPVSCEARRESFILHYGPTEWGGVQDVEIDNEDIIHLRNALDDLERYWNSLREEER